ncbi:hypothetical protein GS461_13635 [Rhodococcus hoagii]|nr:hypothetical protein [Prescottella equi]
MSHQKTVLEELAGRRLTAVEIGEILGVTEKTARKRLTDGLNASDVIAICRAVGVNPVEALVELEFVTMTEAMDFVDADGQLLATADQETLFLELVDRSLTTTQLADLLAERARKSGPVRVSTNLLRTQVEEQRAKAQGLGILPLANEDEIDGPDELMVDELAAETKHEDSGLDLRSLPAVAHEPDEDPEDPDEADDHDWIP